MEQDKKEQAKEEREENKMHHEHSEKHKDGRQTQIKIDSQKIFIALAALLGVILLVNIFFAFGINRNLNEGIEKTKENLKPARIEITLIENSKCKDCYDISEALKYVKSQNVNVIKEKSLDFNSKEAKDASSKYAIQKIPTVIITGEIEKLSMQGFEKKSDALLLFAVNPPYTEASTGEIKGKVALYILKDSKCTSCNDLKYLINQIKGAGIKIAQENDLTSDSDQGISMIKKYGIGFVPTLVLSKDAQEYSILGQAWSQIGSKENDGSYVLRMANPPFINLTTGELKGLVGITYLADKSCTECYNVSLHRNVLTSPQSFAMTINKEEFYDISDLKGKELMEKYNISKVPTIILSKDVLAYPSSNILKQFFSVQSDGSYVFTKLSSVGNYKDLGTNQVIKVQGQQQQQDQNQQE